MENKTTSYPREKIRILFLENVSQTSIRIFHEKGYPDVEIITGALSENELISEIPDVHLLGIRSKTQITENVIKAGKKLQAIGCFCIGVNQVDLKAATEHGIAVFNAPYSNTRSVAEVVIGNAIMLIRHIPEKNAAAQAGLWLKSTEGCYEIREKVLGIIGYGNIGSQVSVLAESLGMRVVYYDITNKLPLGNAHGCKTLEELLKISDVVTLHVPETSATKNLINADMLTCFKPGAILINYSRGTVVDIDALAEALHQQRLSGAAIDVFPSEPKKSGDIFKTPLQGIKNVILTPHIGGSTIEAQQHIGIDVSEKLFNFLENGDTTGSKTIPPIALPPVEGAHRILHIHRNVPGVLSEINTKLSGHNINILGQYLKTNEHIGYVVLDVNNKLSHEAYELLKNVKGTIKVRTLY